MKNWGVIIFLLGFCIGQNVGIGTALPSERLHVAGNLRFDGALMPAGHAGNSGQFLMSNGSGVPPSWANPTPYALQVYTNQNPNIVDITSTTNWTSVVSLNDPIPLAANSIVLAWASGEARCSPGANCQSLGTLRLVIQDNNNNPPVELSRTRQMSGFSTLTDPSPHRNWINSWALVGTYTVTAAGLYNVRVEGRRSSSYSPNTFSIGGSFNNSPTRLVVLVITPP